MTPVFICSQLAIPAVECRATGIGHQPDIREPARVERAHDLHDLGIGDGSVRAWLDQIVEHKILNVIRQYVQVEKRGLDREETGSFHQRAPAAPGREPSPSGVAAAGELREQIEAALAVLPDHYREVIRLVQRERLTLAEAGERMGRTTAATAKLYGRALAKLAERVGLTEHDA